jgi:4-hydroxybenzoate polyprenyltransferase
MRDYLSLIRFSHTIFAMPFALLGFVLGLVQLSEREGHSVREVVNESMLIHVFLPVIGCMIFARSAAMAFNRFTDRHFDALNERTAQREIPAGKIQASHALLFTIVSSLLFVGTTWLLNPLCFGLSFVALFIILIYSYTKQFTALCHLVLGLGLSIAPIGAYLAVTASFHWLPILYAVVVLAWVSGFDIIYALQDEEFDKGHQLHSIPARLGKPMAIRIAQVLHLLSAVLVVVIGILNDRGWFYGAGAAVFISMLIWQHRLVKPNDLRKINLAFMTTNGIASVVFCILVILDLLNLF